MLNIKMLSISALLIALVTLISHLIYIPDIPVIPVEDSKCFPVQRLINFLSAVMLDPG